MQQAFLKGLQKVGIPNNNQIQCVTKLSRISELLIRNESLRLLGNDEESKSKIKTVKGAYLYGDVGVGKTMIMDLFFQLTSKELLDIKHQASLNPKIVVSDVSSTTTMQNQNNNQPAQSADIAASKIIRPKLPVIESNDPIAVRWHFHDFMINIHERIKKWNMERIKLKGRNLNIDQSPEANPVIQIGRAIGSNTALLALDEMSIIDVADAMIIRQLFQEILQGGRTVLVTTSNTHPRYQYKDGINREYFSPFIDMIESHCKVIQLDGIDHRTQETPTPSNGAADDKQNNNVGVDEKEKRIAGQRFQFQSQSTAKAVQATNIGAQLKRFVPISEKSKDAMNEIFRKLCDIEKSKSKHALTKFVAKRNHPIKVPFNRKLNVPESYGGIARFDFKDLCSGQTLSTSLSTTDYQGICDAFHTVIIENIPKLSTTRHNESRRFISLVDQLYDRSVNLFISAEKPPLELFEIDEIFNDDQNDLPSMQNQTLSIREMSTSYRRMASRLHEMCMKQ